MQGYNRITLMGNLGNDPELREISTGTKVAKFSLATSETFKNKQGEKAQETQWHNIVLWGKQAELAEKYLKKGSGVLISGKVKYRSYEKDGQKKYITEVHGDQMNFLPGKEQAEAEHETPKGEDGLPF